MRYLPHTDEDIRRMLEQIGASRLEDLFESIPERFHLKGPLRLPEPLSEPELVEHLRELASRNAARALHFLGAGAYPHHVPAAVDAILRRGEFFTAYTPYQPEVSQGTLQAIFEYQTMLCELTGCDVVNASMYDGATAAAEALLMARRIQRKRNRFLVCNSVHPETVQVCRNYLRDQEYGIELVDFTEDGTTSVQALESMLGDDVAALLVQQPNALGRLEDLPALAEAAHRHGVLVVASVLEPVSLGILEAPARAGADIVTGEGMGLAGGPNFGGPGLGIFGCSARHVWQMPGRLVGQTVDSGGNRGYVLTLAAREQHIRRARATSNICTNEGLCALAAAVCLALLGPAGLERLARVCAANARAARDRLCGMKGVKPAWPDGRFFNEFVIKLPVPAEDVFARVLEKGVVCGWPLGRWYRELEHHLMLCVGELHGERDIEKLALLLEEAIG